MLQDTNIEEIFMSNLPANVLPWKNLFTIPTTCISIKY